MLIENVGMEYMVESIKSGVSDSGYRELLIELLKGLK